MNIPAMNMLKCTKKAGDMKIRLRQAAAVVSRPTCGDLALVECLGCAVTMKLKPKQRVRDLLQKVEFISDFDKQNLKLIDIISI